MCSNDANIEDEKEDGDKDWVDNPNVVSAHQQQAQLLRGAGWRWKGSVSQSSQSCLQMNVDMTFASMR